VVELAAEARQRRLEREQGSIPHQLAIFKHALKGAWRQTSETDRPAATRALKENISDAAGNVPPAEFLPFTTGNLKTDTRLSVVTKNKHESEEMEALKPKSEINASEKEAAVKILSAL